MERSEAILDFWFGTSPDDEAVARRQSALWFGGAAETDRAIRLRFVGDLERAGHGQLDAWTETPRGRLAFILVLDQFARSIHRGTALAFAHDRIALRACREGLALETDRALRPIERVFFYLPLEHAEDQEAQEESVRRFTDLAAAVPPALKAAFDLFLDYAVRHRDVIARFGRFPHRNEALGWRPTPEELAFLREHPAGF